MVWKSFVEDRAQLFDTQRIQAIHLVYDWFEVLQVLETFKNHGELIARNSTVIEEDSVDDSMVDKLACGCQTFTIAITEEVVLEAKCFLVYFVKNWQNKIGLFKTLFEVLDPGIQIVLNTFAVSWELSSFVLLHVLVIADEIVRDVWKRPSFLFDRSIEHAGQWSGLLRG